MNDQWSGKTLFSCRRRPPARPSRSSAQSPARSSGAAVSLMSAPRCAPTRHEALSHSAGRFARCARSWALPEARPDGLAIVALRHEVSVLIDRDRQRGQRPGGGTEDRLSVLGDVELGLVAGAQDASGLLLVQRDRAPGVRADLGERHEVLPAEVLLPGPRLHALPRP